jgi:putative membrane protein
MKIFDETAKARIKEAIKKAEQNSSCEVVAITTKRSGEYGIYGFFVAAVLSMLLPQITTVFGVLWSTDALKLQIVFFMLFGMLAYMPQINILCAPKSVKQKRSKLLAQSSFFRFGLAATTHKRSLMLFVSLDERYVDVLADSEIIDKISMSEFEMIKNRLRESIGKKEFADICVAAIDECGAILSKEFLPSEDDTNELGDDVLELSE